MWVRNDVCLYSVDEYNTHIVCKVTKIFTNKNCLFKIKMILFCLYLVKKRLKGLFGRISVYHVAGGLPVEVKLSATQLFLFPMRPDVRTCGGRH